MGTIKKEFTTLLESYDKDLYENKIGIIQGVTLHHITDKKINILVLIIANILAIFTGTIVTSGSTSETGNLVVSDKGVDFFTVGSEKVKVDGKKIKQDILETHIHFPYKFFTQIVTRKVFRETELNLEIKADKKFKLSFNDKPEYHVIQALKSKLAQQNIPIKKSRKALIIAAVIGSFILVLSIGILYISHMFRAQENERLAQENERLEYLNQQTNQRFMEIGQRGNNAYIQEEGHFVVTFEYVEFVSMRIQNRIIIYYYLEGFSDDQNLSFSRHFSVYNNNEKLDGGASMSHSLIDDRATHIARVDKGERVFVAFTFEVDEKPTEIRIVREREGMIYFNYQLDVRLHESMVVEPIERHDLFGRWVPSRFGSRPNRHIFLEDGTGSRGSQGREEYFTWDLIRNEVDITNELHIIVNETTEIWTIEIDEDLFRKTNVESGSSVTRVREN